MGAMNRTVPAWSDEEWLLRVLVALAVRDEVRFTIYRSYLSRATLLKVSSSSGALHNTTDTSVLRPDLQRSV